MSKLQAERARAHCAHDNLAVLEDARQLCHGCGVDFLFKRRCTLLRLLEVLGKPGNIVVQP